MWGLYLRKQIKASLLSYLTFWTRCRH